MSSELPKSASLYQQNPHIHIEKHRNTETHKCGADLNDCAIQFESVEMVISHKDTQKHTYTKILQTQTQVGQKNQRIKEQTHKKKVERREEKKSDR